jgi:hypothetical protein
MSDPQPDPPVAWRALYLLLIVELGLLTIAGVLLEWWAV